MFEESLVESTPLLRSRNSAPVVTSIAIQAAIAAAILTLPLLHPEVIPIRAPRIQLIAPRFTPPPPPPPPPPPLHVETSLTTSAAPSVPHLAAPQTAAFRDLLTTLSTTPVDNPALTSVSMGNHNPLLSVGVAPQPTARVTSAPAAPTAGKAPIRISQGVSAGLLLSPIQPIYPPIAKAAGVQGTVIVRAVISTSGHIESARVLSGPPMLQGAALEAIREARYRPYLLNNQPTTVDTTFTITFHLGS
jgi:protein TonB